MNLSNLMIQPQKESGSKTWYNAVSEDERTLREASRRLSVELKLDGRGYHLDLTEHQAELAVRYGARKGD